MEAILWKSLCQTFRRLQITSNLCNSQWLGVYDLCHTFLQVSIAQVKTRTTRITMCNKIWSLWPLPTVQDYFWPPRKKTIIHLIQNSEIRSFTLKMVWNISRASQAADKSPVAVSKWKFETLQGHTKLPGCSGPSIRQLEIQFRYLADKAGYFSRTAWNYAFCPQSTFPPAVQNRLSLVLESRSIWDSATGGSKT